MLLMEAEEVCNVDCCLLGQAELGILNGDIDVARGCGF